MLKIYSKTDIVKLSLNQEFKNVSKETLFSGRSGGRAWASRYFQTKLRREGQKKFLFLWTGLPPYLSV